MMVARLRVFFRQQSARAVARYLGTTTATLSTPVWMGSLYGGELKETTDPNAILPPEEDRRLQIVIGADLQAQYLDAAGLAADIVTGTGAPDPNDARILNYLVQAGDRIVGINDVTRDDVALALALGGERGYNQEQIAYGVPEDNFMGIQDIVDQTYRGRADAIVRTELAFASARASLDQYTEAAVTLVDVLDGPGCGWTEHDDPDIADGSTRTMAEAMAYPIAHPNCIRVFLPVL
jgi:hypothetical protein